MASARLFLCLWPDDAVRADLAAWRDNWHWPRGATPVASARLHLTLHFIGDVARERIVSLCGALAVPFTPFDLRLGTPASWPHGIAVLEPLSPPPALAALQRELGARLSAEGMPVEARAYRPHVTLARRAAGAIAATKGPLLQWRVDHYALMESTPGPTGAYTVIAIWPAALPRPGPTRRAARKFTFPI